MENEQEKPTVSSPTSTALLCACTGIKEGTVTSKEYKEAYSVTTMMVVGKTMVPQTIYYDESWIIYISKNGEYGSCEVSKTTFKKVQPLDYVKCT